MFLISYKRVEKKQTAEQSGSIVVPRSFALLALPHEVEPSRLSSEPQNRAVPKQDILCKDFKVCW